MRFTSTVKCLSFIIIGHVALIILMLGVINVPWVARRFVKTPVSFSSELEDWWALGDKQPENNKIERFNISVPSMVLEDLNKRLRNTHLRQPKSFRNTGFEWGFNTNYLHDVLSYWQNKYDWRIWENRLQKFPHYITRIEGLRVHFIHVRPSVTVDSNVRIIPLLLVHGWPGSIFEFYKILPLLTTPRTIDSEQKIAFEVIVPSIPGYGWSEGAHRPGLNNAVVARIFSKLMVRLGHERFYAQGGDWGSFIVHILAIIQPQRVLGLHKNMLAPPQSDPRYWSRLLLGSWLPKGFVIPAKDHHKVWPYADQIVHVLKETGYLHLQATRPDTVGVALSDSPAGLAAYVLEKFSAWTDFSNILLDDGGLTKKFQLDELLTNVMIYWCTDSITTSMRFYKENINAEQMIWLDQEVTVPTGAAAFPSDLVPPAPEAFFKLNHPNLLQYTDMPRGGHFAALEEPELLADDIFLFVNKAEAWWNTSPQLYNQKTVISKCKSSNSQQDVDESEDSRPEVEENKNLEQYEHNLYLQNVVLNEKLQDAVQNENSQHDAVQSENSQQDAVECENSHQDAVESENSQQNAVESENSQQDAIQSENSQQDAVQSENSQQDAVESENSQQDAVENENSHQDAVESENSQQDAVESENSQPEVDENIKLDINEMDSLVADDDLAINSPFENEPSENSQEDIELNHDFRHQKDENEILNKHGKIEIVDANKNTNIQNEDVIPKKTEL